MTTKKCESCGRKAKAGWKYCWGCHKRIRAQMIASNYLTPVEWIETQERKNTANFIIRHSSTESIRDRKHRDRHAVGARQICGEMMKSGSTKK